MGYQRLHMVCRDFILGKETVNQAIENLDVCRNVLAASHGFAGTHLSSLPGTFDADGHHDDGRLPKMAVQHWFDDNPLGRGARPSGITFWEGGEGILSWVTGAPTGFITQWQRINTGVYVMTMRGTRETVDWLECTAEDPSADEPRIVMGRIRPSVYPTEDDPFVALGYFGMFYAYRWAGSSGWEAVDLDFSVAYFSGE